MSLINRLTATEEVALKDWYEKWLTSGRSTKPLDMAAVESVVEWMYSMIGKPKPTIYHCQSPWQMVWMPVMLKRVKGIDLTKINLEQLDSQLDSQLYSQLDPQLRSQLDSQLDSQLRSQLGSQLYSQLYSQLRSQLYSQLYSQIDSQLGSQLRSQLDSQLRSQLDSQIDSQLYSQLKDDSIKVWNSRFFPCWWYTSWYAYYSFAPKCIEKFKLDQKYHDLLDKVLLMNETLHGIVMYENVCFVSARPLVLTVDDQGRLHNETGPAMQYADGYCLYSWKGRMIDWKQAHVIEKPDTITVDEIEKEENQEIRRVMVERYGQDRYIQDSGAQAIHSDDFGTLYKKDMAGGDEPLVMVKVTNSTIEPDGTWKDYWLRVPPDTKTAREGVAWTFGIEKEKEYAPLIQT